MQSFIILIILKDKFKLQSTIKSNLLQLNYLRKFKSNQCVNFKGYVDKTFYEIKINKS